MSNSEIFQLNPFEVALSGGISSLFEASAGTGKTYTLALLYVRLVLKHGGDSAFHRPLMPSDILVVTFTRAATAELIERIRSRLTDTAKVFRAEEKDLDGFDPALVRLRNEVDQEGEESLSAAAYRLEMAAVSMDDSAISTIHSFANKTLKDRSFTAASPLDFEIEDNVGEIEIEAIEDYWRIFFSELNLDEMRNVLSYWKSPEYLRANVKALLPFSEKLSAGPVPKEIIRSNNERITQIVSELRKDWVESGHLANLKALFDDAASRKEFNQRSLNSGHRSKMYSALEAWIDSDQISFPDVFSGASGRRMSSLGAADIWNDPESAPVDHGALMAMARIFEEADALPSPRPAIIQHCAKWVSGRIEEQKNARSVITHDDLLVRLRDSLRGEAGPELAEQIRAAYPVALVDEFQDTDPVQFEIFDLIYRVADPHKDSAFFMIGDPKQSIYGFRGADVFTYLSARSSATRVYSLDTNYRSAKGVVESVNSLFSVAETKRERGAFLFSGANHNPLPFVEVHSGSGIAPVLIDDQEQHALTCVVTDEELGKGEYLDVAGEAAASSIASLLVKGQQGQALLPDNKGQYAPIQPSDIAILVNNAKEASAVRSKLRDHGVSSVYLSERSSVFASAMAKEVLTILKACAEPLDEAALKKALASPLFAKSALDLEVLFDDEIKWEQVVEKFIQYRNLWDWKGVLPVINQVLFDFNIPAHINTQSRQGERDLTDILHIGELLSKAEEDKDGVSALVRHLEEAINDDIENEARQSRLETDYDLVKVITIHKSKGLEFPVVYMPYICNARPAKATDAPFLIHSEDGVLNLHLEADDSVVAAADNERLAEDVRKLYVAMTRACHLNWMALAPVQGFKESALAYVLGCTDEDFSSTSLTSIAMEAQIPIKEFETSDVRYIPARPVSLDDAREAPNLYFESWWIASYSALKLRARNDQSFRLDAADTPQQEISIEERTDELAEESTLRSYRNGKMHQFPRGPRYGVFIHTLLEWCATHEFTDEEGNDFEGFAAAHLDDPGRERMIYRKATSHGLGDHAANLDSWLKSYLSTPFTLPDGEVVSLKDIEKATAEWEFWFESNHADTAALDELVASEIFPDLGRPSLGRESINGMMKGFIDLVFVHKGKYYIVDWKSNWLGEVDSDYSMKSMREAVLEKRYDVQMAIYSVALHRQLSLLKSNYSFNDHFGGVLYNFVRGYENDTNRGVFSILPSEALINAADRVFKSEAA